LKAPPGPHTDVDVAMRFKPVSGQGGCLRWRWQHAHSRAGHVRARGSPGLPRGCREVSRSMWTRSCRTFVVTTS